MATNLTGSSSLLILILDRLIKEKFAHSLRIFHQAGELDKDRLTKILTIIETHNRQLVTNLFLEEGQVETANRRLSNTEGIIITRLYGYKRYRPDKAIRKWEKFSIQNYINHSTVRTCKHKYKLAGYFYDYKLLYYIRPKRNINQRICPRISKDRLIVLFEAAFPGRDIKTWQEFAAEPTVNTALEQLEEELQKQDKNLQSFTTFHASYYSRRKKKIHYFELKLYPLEEMEKGYYEGHAELHYKPERGTLLNLEGKIVRQDDKLTINFLSPIADRRVVLFAHVRSDLPLVQLTTLHGVYAGDSLRTDKEVIAREFIAARQRIIEDTDSYLRIVTALLLKRHNFGIKPYDFTWEQFGKPFSDANSIDDKLKDVIEGIRDQKMLVFHYSHSDNLIISTINFKNKLFELCLTYPKNKGVEEHICNLSAKNKGTKVVLTSYARGHLANVIVIDFNNTKRKLFTGMVSYLEGEEIYTTYLVAVLDDKNRFQKARKLESIKHINDFKSKSRLYETALTTLEDLKNKDF